MCIRDSNLHWEIVRYLQTPYLQRPANFEASDAAAKHIEQMLTLIETGNTCLLYTSQAVLFAL